MHLGWIFRVYSAHEWYRVTSMTSSYMCHGKKSRSKILKVPRQVYISGSWVPKVPRQVYISRSWVPNVACQVYISGFWVSKVPRPVYIPGSWVPNVPRQVYLSGSWVPKVHDKYKFQKNPGSPRSHKYTFQDPESQDPMISRYALQGTAFPRSHEFMAWPPTTFLLQPIT